MSTPETPSGRYELVIVGGTAPGLSVAISSIRSGLDLVRIVEPSTTVAFPELAAENSLDIGYGESVTSIEAVGDDLVVNTNRLSYRTQAVLVALRAENPDWSPPLPVAQSDRVLVDDLPDWLSDQDILVIGYTDRAVELVAAAAAGGAGVVLAASGLDPAKLSPAGEHMLRRLERERRATLLYRANPDSVDVVDGYPMAFFDDRRTPDLQFDYVVFAAQRTATTPEEVGASTAAVESGRLWFVGETSETERHVAEGWEIGERMAAVCFPDLDLTPPPTPIARRARTEGLVDELRQELYNASITYFEPTHSDLWVLRVRPDHGDVSHIPGQYASLGLGYWEPRVDAAVDPGLDDRWHKLIRRSYSISNRIFDEHGYLANDDNADQLEFYIVLVPPTEDNVPALTPRLALKRPGDRLYLGPKVAGRYTLASVIDPESTVLLLSTGTGEAPHNAMLLELLRKGHSGPIVSAVSVRKWADLGYMDKHRQPGEAIPELHLRAPPHPRDRCSQALHPESDHRRLVRQGTGPDPGPRSDQCLPLWEPGDDRHPRGGRRRSRTLPRHGGRGAAAGRTGLHRRPTQPARQHPLRGILVVGRSPVLPEISCPTHVLRGLETPEAVECRLRTTEPLDHAKSIDRRTKGACHNGRGPWEAVRLDRFVAGGRPDQSCPVPRPRVLSWPNRSVVSARHSELFVVPRPPKPWARHEFWGIATGDGWLPSWSEPTAGRRWRPRRRGRRRGRSGRTGAAPSRAPCG